MKAFLLSLLSGDEKEVDSVIVFGAVALLAFIGLSIYTAIQSATAFGPVPYAAGAGSIIGAVAGGKTVRDRLSNNPQQGATQ